MGGCLRLLNEKSSELEYQLQPSIRLQVDPEMRTYVRFGHPATSSSSTTGPNRLSYKSNSSNFSKSANTSVGIGDIIAFCLKQSLLRCLPNRGKLRGGRLGVLRREC